MKKTDIGTAVTASGAGSTVDLAETSPFIANRDGVLVINTSDNWDRTIKVEESDDGTSWADVTGSTVAADKANVMLEVVMKRYYRVNVTVAGTLGEANVYLLGDN